MNLSKMADVETGKRVQVEKKSNSFGNDPEDELSESESSSEEEDENASALTPSVEKAFLRTLSCLKKNDPKIYDKDVKFYDENEVEPKKEKEKKRDEPLFLKDFQRDIIVKKEGRFDDDEDDEVNYDDDDERPRSPTYYEEQNAIRDSFKQALQDFSGEEDEEEEEEKTEAVGGFLKKREKTKKELEKEEADYVAWLKGQDVNMKDEESKKDLKHLRDYWNDPKLNEVDSFLRNFFLDKRYLEQENLDYVPTYDEIVHDSDDAGLSGDEKTIQNQEEFEHKYNFRFEEPNEEFIKSYPRKIEDSLRRTDDKRKKKRQERKERKKQEKERKKEELKKLKARKRKEILEKLEKLKEITGNSSVGFQDEDLEEEYDPDKHDKRMNELFDDEYYEQEGEEKPVFSDEDFDAGCDTEKPEEAEGKKKKKKRKKKKEDAECSGEYEPFCEDPDFNMDCDYDPTIQVEKTGKKKNQKKKQKKGGIKEDDLIKELEKHKEALGEPYKHLEDCIDEFDKLNYEDLIGDTPCRFNYRKVLPNDFGLSTEEILKASDSELNRWCPLSKTFEYRTEQEEQNDFRNYKSKAKHTHLKEKVLASMYSKNEEEEEEEAGSSSQEGNKKKKRKWKDDGNISSDQQPKPKKNRFEHDKYSMKLPGKKGAFKEKKSRFKSEDSEMGVSDTRLQAYGLNPRKYKRKLLYTSEK